MYRFELSLSRLSTGRESTCIEIALVKLSMPYFKKMYVSTISANSSSRQSLMSAIQEVYLNRFRNLIPINVGIKIVIPNSYLSKSIYCQRLLQ